MSRKDEAEAILGHSVSRETLEKLEQFVRELLRWSPRINLIAKTTYQAVWSRHILDSLQLANLVPPPRKRWADLGSGGGLPGIVVACIGAQAFPEVCVTLIESDTRKAAFLTMVSRQLQLNTQIVRGRIELAEPTVAEIVSARALAPLPELLGYCHRHLAPNGTALLPKGRNRLSELEAARRTWHFDIETHPSLVDTDSAIMIIRNLSPLDRIV